MKNRRWRADPRSGPQIIEGPVKSSRHVVFGVNHTTGGAFTPKTAVELLERDDDKPGFLTARVRRTCEEKAGDKYKKRDPFLKRPSETVEEYVKRINQIAGA